MVDASLARSRPITGVLSLWHSTIGKKFVMAVTGLIWFGYLIAHLWGNLKIYAGAGPTPDQTLINQYGVFLRAVGSPLFQSAELLWVARVVLIPAFIIHIIAAIQLSARDKASRPQQYRARKNLESTLASRTMLWGGILILLFVIYHILDFTTGTLNPSFQEGNIYHNVVASFSVWYVAAFYVLAMIALGFHLFHGIWSLFQTMGWNTSRTNKFIRNFATFFAVLLTLGNISIPVSVLAGWIR